MAFTHVTGQSAKGETHPTGSSVSVALANDPTLGNTVCVGVISYNNASDTPAPTCTIADANGNSYTVTPNSGIGTVSLDNGFLFLGYLLKAPANASKTITATFSQPHGGYAAILADEFSLSSGLPVFVIDETSVVGASSSVSTPTVPASGTTLLYSGVTCINAGPAATGVWTNNAGGQNHGWTSAYDVSAVSATAVTYSLTSSQPYAAMGMAIGVTPPPAPASLSQATGEQGFTIATFTVTGTGFDAGGTSTLSFSGSGITVNSYGTRNATTLVANITIAPSAGLTARDVIVTNADTQTGTLAASFTITSGAPVPSAPVSPTSGAQGATITNFTVNGTNFVTPTLSFSGTGITVNSYSVQSSTQVVANITIGAAAATTARDVTVTNADTQTGTLSAAFTITSGGYNVTGNVGVGGATVSYSGTASGSVTADGSGNFTLTSLANGTYTIIPSLTGYAFQPGSLSVTVNGAAITGVNFALPYSVPDCRDYATFPNAAVNVNGTLMYTVLKTDSRAAGAPVDSRAAGAPAKCGTYLQNSRSHGVFGPNE